MNRYEVEINGVRTTLQLSDADAKARGLLKERTAPNKAAKAPANKGKTAAERRAEAAAASKKANAGDGQADDASGGDEG